MDEAITIQAQPSIWSVARLGDLWTGWRLLEAGLPHTR